VNTWKVIFVAALIFGSGMVTGAIVARRAQKTALPSTVSLAETNRPPHMGKPDQSRRFDFLRRAQHELDLTPEQKDQVELIVREGQEEMRAMWEEFSPRMQAHLKKTRDRIAEVLTPEQEQRFEELLKQRRPPKPSEGSGREGTRDGPRHEPDKPPDPPPPR
jgi:Spy/CpxP family protein refolding chaperone